MNTSSADAVFTPPARFEVLDTQGLRCPEPVMLLHAAVRKHESGECLKVLATDPATERDIPRFCQFLGHNLLATERAGDCLIYWIGIDKSRSET